MKNPKHFELDWAPAEGKEVRQLGKHLRQQHTRRQFLVGAGVGTSVMALAALVFLTRQAFDTDPTTPHNNIIAGLSCSQTMALYRQQMKTKLSEEDFAQMQAHLNGCVHCQNAVKRMMEQRSG